jgi:dihydroneopterin aldolase
MPCRIELDELELELRLGCTEAERSQSQPVRFRLRVSSGERFPASRTDRVEDTLDAQKLRDAVERAARAARVHTLERLGALLEETLRADFPRPDLAWELRISKPRYGWSYVHAWST